jgi:hypothetical protein
MTIDGLSTFTAFASAVARMRRRRSTSAATSTLPEVRIAPRAWVRPRCAAHDGEQPRAAHLVFQGALRARASIGRLCDARPVLTELAGVAARAAHEVAADHEAAADAARAAVDVDQIGDAATGRSGSARAPSVASLSIAVGRPVARASLSRSGASVQSRCGRGARVRRRRAPARAPRCRCRRCDAMRAPRRASVRRPPR